MQTYKKTIFVLLVAAAITSISAIAALRGQNGNTVRSRMQKFDKAEFESQFPIADYNAPEPIDKAKRAKRQAKNRKYDKFPTPISETADGVSTFDWATRLPALPVNESEAVVVGQVVEAQAYLSNDKSMVYSEFVLNVDEVLMNKGQTPLAVGDLVAVERDGGRVHFPTGRITSWSVSGQGMPRVGRRYVFFLTHEFPLFGHKEESFYLLTGYELQANHVLPLDNPGGGTHPLAVTYKGADKETFLNDLRAAITKSK